MSISHCKKWMKTLMSRLRYRLVSASCTFVTSATFYRLSKFLLDLFMALGFRSFYRAKMFSQCYRCSDLCTASLKKAIKEVWKTVERDAETTVHNLKVRGRVTPATDHLGQINTCEMEMTVQYALLALRCTAAREFYLRGSVFAAIKPINYHFLSFDRPIHDYRSAPSTYLNCIVQSLTYNKSR